MADIEALCEVEDDGVEGVICGVFTAATGHEAARARHRAERLII
jgi:hypothetical protein